MLVDQDQGLDPAACVRVGTELQPLAPFTHQTKQRDRYVAYRELSMFALAWQLLTGGGSNRRRISHTYEGCWKEGKMR